jgi:hypothetical protein
MPVEPVVQGARDLEFEPEESVVASEDCTRSDTALRTNRSRPSGAHRVRRTCGSSSRTRCAASGSACAIVFSSSFPDASCTYTMQQSAIIGTDSCVTPSSASAFRVSFARMRSLPPSAPL